MSHGSVAVADYAKSFAANPSRVAGDVRGAAATTWNAGSGFVHGQIARQEAAFRRGEGPETIGMTTGQVASYFIPLGAGAKAAATGVRGAEAIAVGGARTLARDGGEAALRAAGAETRVVTLAASPAARQAAEASGARLLQGAEAGGGTVRVARSGGVTAQDLAAASRQSGREVALYRNTATNERFVAVGTRTGVEVPQGSRVIAHTQPGAGAAAVRASVADEAALARLGQRSLVIIDQGGTAATRFRATEQGAALARTESGAVRIRAPEATKADLDVFRVRLGVSETHTVAAARTDILGLEGCVFEGASPKVLREAKLPQPAAGPVSAPFTNPLLVRHAEERVANEVAAAIDALPAGTNLSGRTLSIHVSQEVCSACKAGLRDLAARSGVLKQLSSAILN